MLSSCSRHRKCVGYTNSTRHYFKTSKREKSVNCLRRCRDCSVICKYAPRGYRLFTIVESRANSVNRHHRHHKCSDANLPFQLRRRQFPVRLAFSMTINKSQRWLLDFFVISNSCNSKYILCLQSTLDFVGLYLPQPVFTHGQLYVALSRVGAAERTKVCVRDGTLPRRPGIYTRNVVYHEVLNAWLHIYALDFWYVSCTFTFHEHFLC